MRLVLTRRLKHAVDVALPEKQSLIDKGKLLSPSKYRSMHEQFNAISKQTTDIPSAQPQLPESDMPVWLRKRDALRQKGIEKWAPAKRLSQQQMSKLRHLHATDPQQNTAGALSRQFRVSVDAVTRILRSRFEADDLTGLRQEIKRMRMMEQNGRKVPEVKKQELKQWLRRVADQLKGLNDLNQDPEHRFMATSKAPSSLIQHSDTNAPVPSSRSSSSSSSSDSDSSSKKKVTQFINGISAKAFE